MIIVDTGFWLALMNKKDSYHQLAKQALQKHNEPLITTWCVVTETCYLLLTRQGVKAQIAFIHSCEQGLFDIFNLERHHGVRIAQLMQKYKDLPM
ncbi:MAG: PIN domain-containing protein, partial [Cyanobacteriota bacterium]|nr:PIN domain-containing protein [Cyanobacteriota bacterium]